MPPVLFWTPDLIIHVVRGGKFGAPSVVLLSVLLPVLRGIARVFGGLAEFVFGFGQLITQRLHFDPEPSDLRRRVSHGEHRVILDAAIAAESYEYPPGRGKSIGKVMNGNLSPKRWTSNDDARPA